MKFSASLLAALFSLGMFAQEPAKPAAEAAKAEAQKPADAEAKKEAESPAPDVEKKWEGTIDLGARWISGVGGDFNTYRSVVNLGEGIRLMGLDLHYNNPGGRFVDQMHLQGSNWGGDPYNTARLDVGKQGLWRYNGIYSNIAYFNYLPSFADPTAVNGTYLNQRSYDTTVRNFDNLLELFPGKSIVPYIGFLRNESEGDGITNIVSNFNEYPVRNEIDWKQDTVREGVRLEFGRFHSTLEAGQQWFKDDQEVYATQAGNGNRTNPYLGRRLVLDSGRQGYRLRGDGEYYKAIVTSNITNWLDLYGQFLYSNPDVDVTYNEGLTGTLVDTALSTIFYQQRQDQIFGNSRQPHTSGSAGGEARFGKLRVRANYDTDRFHTASFATQTLQQTSSGTAINSTNSWNYNWFVNNHRQLTEAVIDVHRKLSFRGGYRYEWGDASIPAGFLGSTPYQQGEQERIVGLFGVMTRPVENLSVNFDFERSDGKQVYFRTGLMDYTRARMQARYQIRPGLNIGYQLNALDNKNPSAGVDFTYSAYQNGINLHWLPNNGKLFTVLVDYTRSAIRSHIDYLIPNMLTYAVSEYVDNAHMGTALLDVNLAPKWSMTPRVTAGGTWVRTSGSRPTRYYQPIGRVIVPLHRRIQAYGEYRWYGLTQAFYLYEGFRSTQIVGGVRLIL